MPPHAVLRKGEMAYVQFDLLTDLGQKWERTNIRIASGIFLERERERKKNNSKSCSVQGTVPRRLEALLLRAPESGFLVSFLQNPGHCT